MRAALEGQLSSTWQRFQDVTAVLVAAGALAADTLKVRFLNNDICVDGILLLCTGEVVADDQHRHVSLTALCP